MENICFTRSGEKILQDISWEMSAGEHWCVLGANGSGKTTLLNMLSGYEWPSSGNVTFAGEVYGDCDLPSVRKKIGWVSSAMEQKITGNRRLNQSVAKELVASGLNASLKWYGDWTDELEAKTGGILERLNAGSVANRPFSVLSQGERKRVLIARAMVHEPALLILDEPCAGLDPVSRQAFLDDVGRFAATEKAPSTVLVTHHVEEIGPWVTHALGLRAGRAVFDGDVDEVLTGANLELLYGRPCALDRDTDGYRLRLLGDKHQSR